MEDSPPPSPPPRRERAQSRSRSRSGSRSRPRSRSRSRSRSIPRQSSRSHLRSHGRERSPERNENHNPGNILCVTGLSFKVTERDLEKYFSKEGKVVSCSLVMDPRTKMSRGFAFISMETVEDANRCVKYLNKTVLDGRHITVEKSRRRRPRSPTPGRYLGYRDDHGDRRRYRGGSGHDDYPYRRSRRHSPHRGGSGRHDYPYRRSPKRSPHRGGSSKRDRSRSLSHSPRDNADQKHASGSS